MSKKKQTQYKLKASEYAKKLGLPSLKEASKISGESTQTLNNWLKIKPFVFFAVIEKSVKKFKSNSSVNKKNNK